MNSRRQVRNLIYFLSGFRLPDGDGFSVHLDIIEVFGILQAKPDFASLKLERDGNAGPVKPGFQGMGKINPTAILDRGIIGRNFTPGTPGGGSQEG
jgi:hypothetical protein